MLNWIQGNDNKKRFKCLVIHDGVISTIIMFYGTENYGSQWLKVLKKIKGLKLMKEMNKERIR